MPYKPPSVESSPYSSLGVLESGVASSSRYWDSLQSMFQSLVEKKPTRCLAARGLGAAVLTAMAFAGGTASASGEKGTSASLSTTPVDTRPNPNSPLTTKKKELAPVLSCKVDSVRRVGNIVVAAGGCKLGAEQLPAKYNKWTWTQRSADLSGSVCQFGTGRGIGKRSNLLAYPAGVPRISGSALPGLLDVTFRVTAHRGKKVAIAERSLHKRTAESRVMCGAPPKLVSLDGPTPSALTWATPPTFDGAILRAGTVESRGNGQCRWLKPTFEQQGAYLTQRTSDFVCANGYRGGTGIHVYYFVEDKQRCDRAYQSISSFAVPLTWGLGRVGLQMNIATFDGNQWLPYNGDNFWQTSSWFEALGNVDPCATDLRTGPKP